MYKRRNRTFNDFLFNGFDIRELQKTLLVPVETGHKTEQKKDIDHNKTEIADDGGQSYYWVINGGGP